MRRASWPAASKRAGMGTKGLRLAWPASASTLPLPLPERGLARVWPRPWWAQKGLGSEPAWMTAPKRLPTSVALSKATLPGTPPHGLGHVLGTLAGALRGLAPEGLGSADIGVGRARRGALAPRDGAPCPVVRLAETRPALSWPPLELGEAPPIASVPLACRLPPARPHAALGGWVRARVARLALESREDPGGRVPLPAPRLGVFLKPPVDGRLEGLERGTRRVAPVREPGRWVSHIPIPSRRWLRDLAGPRNMSDGLAPSR